VREALHAVSQELGLHGPPGSSARSGTRRHPSSACRSWCWSWSWSLPQPRAARALPPVTCLHPSLPPLDSIHPQLTPPLSVRICLFTTHTPIHLRSSAIMKTAMVLAASVGCAAAGMHRMPLKKVPLSEQLVSHHRVCHSTQHASRARAPSDRRDRSTPTSSNKPPRSARSTWACRPSPTWSRSSRPRTSPTASTPCLLATS
jgi:hypothetical protein